MEMTIAASVHPKSADRDRLAVPSGVVTSAPAARLYERPVDITDPPGARLGRVTFQCFPVRYDDLRALLAQGPNRAEALSVMPEGLEQTWERVQQLLRRGPSAAVEARWRSDLAALGYERDLLALGGVAQRFPGVAEAWAVIGARVTELGVGFRFVRFARRLFDRWLEEGRWHRVDCGVPAAAGSVGTFLAWTGALGFAPEARLQRACSDGSDMIVCVRFPEHRSG
jgi:hypothetical protein